MSVRYTATWYDVTQARQQEHTPYTQTRTGPAGRSSGQWGGTGGNRQGKQPAGTHTIHTDTYRPGRQVFTSLTTLTQYCCDRQLGETVYAGLI